VKVYTGKRGRTDALVTVSFEEPAKAYALPLRLDLQSHSPTGFEWGYGGSGAAQLALALLADCLEDDEKALALYQAFKWEVISKLLKPEWRITEAYVRGWAEAAGSF